MGLHRALYYQAGVVELLPIRRINRLWAFTAR
jgi:hypothetical protein